MDIITTHLNADFDTIASMLAACKLYPGAVCVLPGSQEETVKGFLVQSAFYNLPMRKPREIDLDKVTRLILVDIRSRARIGIFGELIGRPGVPVHVYDHHPDEDADVKGDVEVIRRVGSTTTILVRILKERGIPITPDEATVMMLGIYEDTGSLGFPSTTVDDYLAAAHLLSCGAKLAQVSDILARDLTSGQISLLYDLIQGTRTYTIRGVEVVIAEARREEYVGDLALLVHKLRDMEAVSILFVICQMGDRVVLVREGWPAMRAGYSLPVAFIDPPRTLVLRQSPPEHPWDAVWSFHVRPLPHGRSRLISRGRSHRHRGMRGALDIAVDAAMDPVTWFMTRGMLLGIRRRAEGDARNVSPGPSGASRPRPPCTWRGGSLLARRLDEDVAHLSPPRNGGDSGVLTTGDLDGLPDPARRYLMWMGVIGRPRVAAFRARFVGEFRMKPDGRWMPYESWQYNRARPVTRLVRMRIDAARLVPMFGSDTYVDKGDAWRLGLD